MMKKILIILLGIALVLPLYSQEYDDDDYDDDDYEYNDETGYETTANEVIIPKEYPRPAHEEQTPKEKPPKEKPAPEPEKKKYLARRYFENGFDMGIGFDNGLAGLSDIFRKKIEIDLKKISQSIPEDGSGFNFDLSAGVFMNILNIQFVKGLWDFGFIVDVDGGVNINFPKSLFTLISDGNADHESKGKISASGGIFTEIGLKASAKYRVGGRTLSVGLKPTIFTPVVYIPSSTGISYHLYTERPKVDGTVEEGLFLDTEGGINVYTPTPLNHMEPGRFLINDHSGFDLSLGAEYAFSPFLDIGGNLTNIPITAAILTNEMKLRLIDKENPDDDFGFDLSGDFKTPELDFAKDYKKVKKEVRRPLRFDLYAHYRPFKSELLVVRPNIGFSVNINKEDEKWYFNGGLEAGLNLFNFLVFYVGSGYKEEIWRQRAGLALNFRVFELDLEAMLRNQTFEGCFKGQGLGFKLGLRFGW